MATNVKISTGIPKIIQHNTAVNMISSALAKVLRIEFSCFRNNAVVMPMPALLKIMAKTLPLAMDARLSPVNASDNVPLYQRTAKLHKTESTYMKKF